MLSSEPGIAVLLRVAWSERSISDANGIILCSDACKWIIVRAAKGKILDYCRIVGSDRTICSN
jgi:hypothetical protein